MSFEHHTEDDCDRCNKHIGKENLVPLPFLYKDMNDKFHEDKGGGYRQYVVCKDCMEVERKIKEEKTKETLMKMSEGMDFFKVPN